MRFILISGLAWAPSGLLAQNIRFTQGPAADSLTAAAAMDLTASLDEVKSQSGDAFHGPEIMRILMGKKGGAGRSGLPVNYVEPARVRRFAWGGAILGAAAGFFFLGPLGAVAGALAGAAAGAYAGHKIYQPSIGILVGAAAAVALGFGIPGLILGAILGGLLGLTLTFLL